MSVPIPGKSSWPELVGVLAKLAATTIAHDRPDVSIDVLLSAGVADHPAGGPELQPHARPRLHDRQQRHCQPGPRHRLAS
nr:putative proteinase inhibitor I13, potato inhibitor I [Saccharum hybrid cultivar R570]